MKRLLCAVLCLLLGLPTVALAASKSKKAAAQKPAASPPPPEPKAAQRAEEADMEEPLAEDEEAAPNPEDLLAPAPPVPVKAPVPAQAAPAGPAQWRSESAYGWLEQAVGPQALKLLVEHGYLTVYRLGSTKNLAHVQWELLEPLVTRAPKLLEAQAAITGVRNGRPLEGKEDSLRAILELPPLGLSTARIRSAASVLLDWSAERQAAGSLPLPERPFASMHWARDFVYRYNAREVRDPSPLVDPYFLEMLLAPKNGDLAQSHLKAHVQARYTSDISELLARDTKAGQMSDELRGWIMKYLDDNRRALRLIELPTDFAALFQSNQLQRELTSLRTVVDALSKDPRFLESLRDAAGPGQEPSETVRITLGGLHLHSSPYGEAYDPGDRATLSAAYWLDGIKKGESVAVQELAFADRGAQGLELLLSRERKLSAGGPYTLEVQTPVKDARPFAVRFVLHAAGAKPTQRDENVSPAPALEEATRSLARADALIGACKLKEGSQAYGALAQELFSRAGREPFDRLASQLKARQRRADTASEEYDAVQGLLEAIRSDASARECAFATERGEQARSLLRRLPAGCSRDLAPEVNQLLVAAAQRRRDQDTFWSAVESGRKLERTCHPAQASKRFAAALAVLDGDAAAKCGAAEVEYKTVQERDLPAALAADAIRDDFNRLLGEAEKSIADSDASEALGTLNPLLARLGAHSSAPCYQDVRKRGEELAAKAALLLTSPSAALARVPDPVDATLGAVTRERTRLLEAAEATRRRELEQQAPVSLGDLPEADGPHVAPEMESGEVPAKPNSPAAKGGKKAATPSGEDDGKSLDDEEIATELGLIEADEEPAPKKKPAKKAKSSKRR